VTAFREKADRPTLPALVEDDLSASHSSSAEQRSLTTEYYRAGVQTTKVPSVLF
jgi:hypothetical protein